METAKKLIEVALPLEAINKASAREKSIRHGHPSTLHLWWARRPLAAARAVIFAQMVDDPSAHPDLFPTDKAQDKERKRLFKIIEELVKWENTTNETVLRQARDEICASWRRTCAENADHPRAKELFDRYKLPAFHDPFAGGGALPLEAQRLGLEAYASDLNPVAVLINKAMIEIPPKFAGKPPVNPEWQSKSPEEKAMRTWTGAQGLAEDVRYYGKWMRDEAEKRIGHLYPKVKIPPLAPPSERGDGEDFFAERPDLIPYAGKELTVIAWLWARTVKSPNPAFAHVDVPLASTFMLSTKAGKEAYVEPVIEDGGYRFTVKVGKPKNAEAAKNGTKLARANFQCLMSETPISGDYIKAEGKAGRMGARLMAIVVEGERGRIYVDPISDQEIVAQQVHPIWKPEQDLIGKSADQLPLYGISQYWQVFTPRQLLVMAAISELVEAAQAKAKGDALIAYLSTDIRSITNGGIGAVAYSEAIGLYLAFAQSKACNRNTSLCLWEHRMDRLVATFGRQALPMVWDYAETNPLANAGGDIFGAVQSLCEVIDKQFMQSDPGYAEQLNATTQNLTATKIVSTDPPYYDNVGYADLSDFFYIWLRKSLQSVFSELFTTMAVPKSEELVATATRHGSRENAESFFLRGMTQAMHRITEQAHPGFPVTIYYAFKQSESDGATGNVSTGWETFLDAVIRAGFMISGTWPVRTEQPKGLRAFEQNALASSIVIVCRQADDNAASITRRDFLTALKAELPEALVHMQRGNIAPVDLAQAAIGPGMSVFTRYAKVLDAEGKPLTVRDALALINQILDETLAEQEGDFDADSRWALAWFEQFGFAEGEYGVAETLSKAKNTSVAGLVDAGFLQSKSGKVRILKPSELPADWDPEKDKRLTNWETVHHLIRVLESGGEAETAILVAKLGSKAETARELCYRLYTLCERKKRAAEALSYNALVQSWPEISRLAAEQHNAEILRQSTQPDLFIETEE
jgi:putative DNA methylase